jgi:hypothetical protein
MNSRRKVILVEAMDLTMGGLLLLTWLLDSITIQVLLVLNYVLQFALAYAYIKFIDDAGTGQAHL